MERGRASGFYRKRLLWRGIDESTWNATWISLLTPSTMLEGRFGIYWAEHDSLPRKGDISQHFDLDTNVASVNADHHR